MRLKKRGITFSIKFKPALDINYDAPSDKILEQIMFAIEQSDAFHPVYSAPVNELEAELKD